MMYKRVFWACKTGLITALLISFIACEQDSGLEFHSLSEVSYAISINPLLITYESNLNAYVSEDYKITIYTPGSLDQQYWFGYRWAEPTAEASFTLMDGSPISTIDIDLRDDWSYDDHWAFNSPDASDWLSTHWQFVIPASVVTTVQNSTTQTSFRANIRLIGQDEYGSYLGYTQPALVTFNF